MVDSLLIGVTSSYAAEFFSEQEIERARRYHRPLYLALGVEIALSFVALLLFIGPLGDLLYRPLEGLHWAVATGLYTAFLVILLRLVHLPIALWRSLLRERRFGLSTQSARGWFVDWTKALVLQVAFTATATYGLVTFARALPDAWAVPLALVAAGFVLLVTFASPFLIEPLFNRFEPLRDDRLHTDLRALAERAGAPVRAVLVADASRRTRKANAYVSGLGATRRVVLFDTFLQQSTPRAIATVMAHELGHRRLRHEAKLTLLATVGVAAAVGVLWLVLGEDAADPRQIPVALLVVSALQLLAAPLGSAVSRRWERAADRFALELTRDPEAFESAHRDIAVANLSDLDPPRAVHLLFGTHPTIPARIAAARRFATV
jgi:STE24 endopeptidase